MDQKKALKQISLMTENSKKMRLAAEKWKNDFEVLISVILSARTKDETTIPVATRLFENYPKPKKLLSASLKDVEGLIKPINFYKNKSRNIINCSREIVEIHNGKIPRSMEKLKKLPGVGSKTANVFLSEMGEKGIGVDTHVSYISQKLEWTKNKKPEKIEEDLKNLFEEKHWNKVNSTLVRFGKSYTNRKEKDMMLEKIKNGKIN